jgi:uncharacterized protein
MRKLFLFIYCFIAATSLLHAQIVPHNLLPPKPANARPVVDEANILSDAEESRLVSKLKAYNDTTSNQIVVVTVTSLHGYASDQYATEIGHYWGVGGQEKMDNGIVILLSTGTTEEDKKRHVFIATGYGLEGVLSAIVCKRIADNEMVPSLKAGNYYQAFDNAINAIIKAAAGEYKAPDGYKKKKDSGNGIGILILVIIMVILFVLIGRRGGGNGGMMSRRGFGNVAETLFWASLLSGNGGGGGSSGGGGSDNSGSGGFGDFGGGDFGGGGAGSDW